MPDLARWLVERMPAEHRARYGEEMVGLARDSSRPTRDLIDIAACTLRWRMEALVKDPLFIIAATIAAISLFACGYAVAELAGGIGEIPRHWWSTLPFAGLLLAAALAVARSKDRPTPRRGRART